MLGSVRAFRVPLTPLALLVGSSVAYRHTRMRPSPNWLNRRIGRQGPRQTGCGRRTNRGRRAQRRLLLLSSRSRAIEPAQPFVPLRPSTVDDRRRIEAVRLYSAARALEDQRAWSDAVTLLQEALKLDPDSIAIARRLSRIYVGALGRPDLALQYGKRVLAIEPGDTEP